MSKRVLQPGVFLIGLLVACTSCVADDASGIEFFETKIRPLLALRCYKCHSADSKSLKAGLRLDHIDGIRKGGDSGPAVVAGKPDESLLIQSVRYESYEMPPSGKLKAKQIDDLVRWVELGAPWPKDQTPTTSAAQKEGYDWAQVRQHWAWQPIQKPQPPAGNDDADRIQNPIDQFVVSRLREGRLTQPAATTATVFVRRAFLDLIGIPPRPKQLKDWSERMNDGHSSGQSLNNTAVAELIDWLLAQPQYGERWGRHWLDVARYSDAGGWSQDNRSRPSAWRYRDWVVDAFNNDLPYSDFVKHQIAGDSVNKNAAIGTGFFAIGPLYRSDGGDPESTAQAKSETLDDRIDTFSRAFLGLTVACARCHDHKFDPIPTQDYYSLAGIFNSTGEGDLPLAEADVVKAYNEFNSKRNELEKQLRDIKQKARKEKRDVTADEKTQIETWQKQLSVLKANAPPKYDFAHTLHDSRGADMAVALRGNLLKKGPVAPRRFLRIVAGDTREHFKDGSGRRQLAEAVADPQNPLTARVIVNRIWLNHFGKAIVRSPGNFGTLGHQPTHPQLLDWLAATLIDSGWSLKSLHRMIMTSATYRSSSQFNQQAFAIDADNTLLWRTNPRRMDVETWRDSLLAVTGELASTIGGPPVNDITTSKRRTLYARVSRNGESTSDKFLRLFDFPTPRASSAKRVTSVVPQQFLFMMNSPFMVDRARVLAAQLETSGPDMATRIENAYNAIYGRKPTTQEQQTASRFLNEQAERGSVLNRWQQYCQVLLSSNEFMYIR